MIEKMKNNYDISILVPTMNEEITIEKFIHACNKGFKKLNLNGQIIIADSSTDKTPIIAKKMGAYVVDVKEKGLGNAYIKAIPYIESKYVILGDADLTYDFSEIDEFYLKLKEGYEFVIGNRFKGNIQKNAMPKSHQYFGSPLTSFFLNLVFNTKAKDIHCGMRGLTTDALKKINLVSQSWQYASEMIIKAKFLKIKTIEVPINFYKDIDGRESNLKRIGFWAPWYAGWITIKTILTWGIANLFIPIGFLLLITSIPLLVSLHDGPIRFYNYSFSLHSMLFFSLIFHTGLQLLMVGCISKLLYKINLNPIVNFILKFENAFLIFILLFIGSIFFIYPLFNLLYSNGMELPFSLQKESYFAVTGINIMFLGIVIFLYSLLSNLIKIVYK